MKRLLIILCLFLITPAWAQQKPPQPQRQTGVNATVPGQRFQLIQMSEYSVIKIDTHTGKTWKSINCGNDAPVQAKYYASISGCWAPMPEYKEGEE